MEKNVRSFTIHSQEIRKDKQVFIASSAEINGKWYKIKFTKECGNAPRAKGLYELTINFDDCSLENGKPYTTNSGKKGISIDTIWVRKITEIRQFTEEELKAENRVALGNVFGV